MTDKIQEEIFRGIHFIRMSNLPDDQKEHLENWVENEQVIKILIDGKIIPDCVQFSTYSNWYSEIYTAEVQVESIPEPKPAVLNLSLQK